MKIPVVFLVAAVIALVVALAVTLSLHSAGGNGASDVATTTSNVPAACEDFNQFVCSSYLAQYPGFPLMSLLAASNERVVQDVLSSINSATSLSVFNNFLQSCINDNATIVDHVATLQPWFDTIDGNVSDLSSYISVLGQVRTGTGAAVLLELTVQQVAGRAGVLFIAPGGLSKSPALYEWTYEYEELQASMTAFFSLITNDSDAASD